MKETYQNGDVIEYSYDNGGNLLSKTVNGVVSNSYTYGDTEWKDLLTGFNGTTITYDEIGNPQNWRDEMSFTWVNGRQLGALQKGDLNVSYSYNSDGLRVSKTVNGVKTEYVWDGSSLIGQKTGNNVLVYLYAADGLAGFQYNGVNYYYLKNGQGDVVGILDSSGTLVAKYTYDAWGKLLSVTDATGADKSADSAFIGNINPVRYRSYYYDTETGVYYLQSRYYDPEVGRFINADDIMGVNEDIHAYNLFAYCGNNPVNLVDYSGHSSSALKDIGGLAVLGMLASMVAGLGPAAVASAAIVLGVAIASTVDSSDLDDLDDDLDDDLSDQIDWEKPDYNHVLKGSRGTRDFHGPGWRKFGIDPEGGSDSWLKLVPILKDVLNTGDKISERGIQNGNGARIIEYAKDFVDKGIRVIVRVWERDGTYRFSDAYNRPLGG